MLHIKLPDYYQNNRQILDFSWHFRIGLSQTKKLNAKSNSIILTELGGQVTDLDEALFLSLPNCQAQVKVHSCCGNSSNIELLPQG